MTEIDADKGTMKLRVKVRVKVRERVDRWSERRSTCFITLDARSWNVSVAIMRKLRRKRLDKMLEMRPSKWSVYSHSHENIYCKQIRRALLVSDVDTNSVFMIQIF